MLTDESSERQTEEKPVFLIDGENEGLVAHSIV
jgi:hypothetical protein